MATQVSLNSGAVASAGALALQTNGTTAAITLDTSQNATFAGKITSAGSLLLASNGTTTAATIDTSGNLGLGVTPSAWGSAFKGVLEQSVGSYVATVGSGSDFYIGTNSYYDGTSWTYKVNGAATQTRQTGGAHYWYNAASGTAGIGFTFTQAMTLDASGNLLVGTTSQIASGFVCLSFANNVRNGIVINDTDTGSGTSAPMIFRRNGSQVGSITTTTTSTAYVTSSDYRLKENIVPMADALSVVAQLKPCTYTWKSDGSSGQGFIAHELQAVVSDAVVGEKDAVDEDGNPKYQGIDTSFLVATLTAAIQEQQALITQLTARITALEGA